jgi:hypothetical protein
LRAACAARLEQVPRLPSVMGLLSDAFSRGGVESAFHLVPNALHGTSAHADFAGDSENTFPGSQLSLDAPFQGFAYPRPTERLSLLRPALTRH